MTLITQERKLAFIRHNMRFKEAIVYGNGAISLEMRQEIATAARAYLGYSKKTIDSDILRSLRHAWIGRAG